MVIDAHTHVFPDKIADKSIKTLEEIGNETAVIGGTAEDLLISMKKSGVDISIILPVVTKPQQFENINRFAAELNKNSKLLSLGGIHPHCENINNCLDFIVSLGLKGVKLHPDYQETDITDEGYIKIIEGCRKRDLKVFIHAGIDPAYPNHIHCPPNLSAQVIRELTPAGCEPFIVLAHLGGANQLDMVERCLIGLPVYMDTSYVLNSIERERVYNLIKSHGHKKILFATDSPWRDAKQYIKIINSIPLNENERHAILYENCAKLLDIDIK